MDERKRFFLNVEDDPYDSETVRDALSEAGLHFEFRRVETRSQYLASLEPSRPDLILCDFNLPLFDGLTALSLAREKAPEVPFIFLSGTMGERLAVECLQRGATDYILKGDPARLVPAVRRALEEADLRRAKVRAERELIHGEKLALIGQLAAGIAHEINNPVTFVNLNLEAMAEYADAIGEAVRRCRAVLVGAEGPGADPALEVAGRILGDAPVLDDLENLPKLARETLEGMKRVAEIIQSLRGFSRNDSGEFTEVDVVECVETALRIGWNEIKHKCEIRKDFPSSPPRVRGRSGQLTQVFLNLLVNAAQAIPERGRLEVEVAEEGGRAVIRVRDDGAGIAPENLDRLFTPFFTTKPPGQGTGLGLYVSEGIVKSHGGEIRATSEPGKGAEFTVTIPLSGKA